MYKKILVPLDGSDYSESILEHVKAVAVGCSVPEVVLLTVLEPFRLQTTGTGAEWLRKLQKEATAAAMAYLGAIADKLKTAGVNTSLEVIEGMAAEAIIDYAGKNQVDLIIMSTRGRGGVSRWLYGSVADKVVRSSVTPVLAAPPSALVKK